MKHLLLVLVVFAGLVSCQVPSSPSTNLSEAAWQWSSPDSLTLGAFEATLPGHVLEALVHAGLAPDPHVGTHEREVQWVETLDWHLRTHVPSTSVALPGDSAVLSLEGIDTYASVFVNDVLVLSADNAHRTWTTQPFPMTEGGLTIELRFAPIAERGQQALDAHGLVVPASNEAKPIGTQTSPMTRKPGYQFGWDWGPRLAGPGVSGSMLLLPWDAQAPVAPPICTVIHVDSALARVAVRRHDEWALEVSLNGHDVPFTWVGHEVHLKEPALWWPGDMGDHALYEWTWTHLPSNTQHEHTLGLRTVEWVERKDKWGTSFQLEVNGIPVQARGANVVPPDFHQTQNPALWKTLAQQARDANMNMVRVWGGGVYPPDAFFDACDASGLLVWQDFMFACAMVPGDKDFTQNVRQEAEEQVRRLTHHPSLALWCGNNEVERAWESWGWQDMYKLHGPDSARLAEAYHRLFYDVLPEVVSRESDAFYLPTSPTLDRQSGDEHAWNVWFGLEDFGYYSRHGGRFASEYGLQSLPDKHTLLEAGIHTFNDEALQFRQRSRMDWLEPGFDGWDMMHHFMSKTTGPPASEDLDDWIFKSQWTQAEGLRQALERHRTSEGRYAGSLYWSLNDVWPAVSWSTIDHAGRWKLAHHAARRANAPRTALWVRHREDSLCFDVFNDLPHSTSGVLHVAIKDFEGRILNEAQLHLDLEERRSTPVTVGAMDAWRTQPQDSYLSWHWTDASEVPSPPASALWCAPVEAHLQTPAVQCNRIEDGFELSANTYVPLVQLTANVPGRWSDNGMALEPGRPQMVQFTPEAPISPAAIDVVIRCEACPPQ